MRTKASRTTTSIRLLVALITITLAACAQPFGYVADQTGNTVSVVYLPTGTYTSIPISGGPSGLAVAPGGAYFYVTAKNNNSVAFVSAATASVVNTVTVDAGPVQVAVTPNGATVYSVNQAGTVSAIDTASATVLASIPVASQPSGLAITPDGSQVLVTSLGSTTLSVISTSSNTVVATWPYRASAIAISKDGRFVYLAHPLANSISVHNPATGSVTGIISGITNPTALALAGRLLYAVNGSTNSVTAIDVSTRKAIATVPVGVQPSSVALAADGARAYVTNMQDGSVSVINTSTNTIIATLAKVAQSPAAVAVTSLMGGGAPTGLPPLPPGVVLPTLPQLTVDTTYPTVTGKSTPVHAGDDLQAALNAANCGDELVLDAGATFTGEFIVPATPCSQQILVRGPLTGLPPGVRVQQSQAHLMPTLQTNVDGYGATVLSFADGASNWYFAGINFTAATGITGVWDLIEMGGVATSLSQLPQHIVFDRVLVHGNDQMCVRGFDANAIGFALINSQVWDFSTNYQDTQDVLAYNSPGPFLISNNFLEATGENVMFGPGPSIPGIVPSDATITRNYFHKQLSWQGQPAGQPYDVKNDLEIKAAQRVFVDSNVFDVTFTSAQNEFTIMNCSLGGGVTCTDWTLTNNIFEHGPEVIVVAGSTPVTGQRVLFRNNLGIDINNSYGCCYGVFAQVAGTSNVTMDHNTVLNTPYYMRSTFFGDPPPSTDVYFTLTNNIVYGPLAANSLDQGAVLAAFPGNANISYDVFVGDWWPNNGPGLTPGSPLYPPSDSLWTPTSKAAPVAGQPACNYSNKPLPQCWPLDFAKVGFNNFKGGDYSLAPTSPYHNAASDGVDVGANVAAILAATAGVQ